MSNRDGDDDIYKMRADGSNVTKLTHNSIKDLSPRWSPDGQFIHSPATVPGAKTTACS